MPTVPVVPVAPGAPAAAPLPDYRDVPITYFSKIVLIIIPCFKFRVYLVIKDLSPLT